MSAQTTQKAAQTATQAARSGDLDSVNEVRLVGRLSQDPEMRELPSGDTIWTFRVVVPRLPTRERPRPPVDALECCAWSGRLKRSVRSWRAGDVVEVTGSLRRRFYRVGGGAASRVEVEAVTGRVIRRASSG